MSKTLRKYQQEAINACLKRLSEGINKSIIVLPTGAGKTFMATQLVEIGQFKRVLFCVDAEELADQAGIAFLKEKFDDSLIKYIEDIGFIEYVRKGGVYAGSDYKVGLIKAEIFQPHGSVVIASLQTLWRRLDKLNPDDFDLIIIDECHIATAKRIIQSINFFTPKLLLGITATPIRSDGVSLNNVFQEIVYDYPIKTAVEEKYLCELDAIRVKTNVSLDKVHTLGGDLNEKELANEVDTQARNILVADSYLKYANGKQAIGYTVNIQHAIHLAEVFAEKGIKATAISSNEELTGDRSLKVRQFKDRKIDVVFNCGILVKGFNHDNVGCIIHACPTKSLTKWLQATGRCTRLKDEEYVKKFGQQATILDIVDSTNKHSLINAWNLDSGLPPEERTFITTENRNKLIEDRLRKSSKIDSKTDKDERIDLLTLPRVKLNLSPKMSEPATLAQLNAIKNWGFNIEDVAYTKQQINEIFMSQPATDKQVNFLKAKGFKIDGFVSKAVAIKAFDMLNNK